MTGYVYLVWAKGTDKYKIGSSQYPEKRLPTLQTGSPVALELIAAKAFANHEFEEKQMHSRWRKFRMQGEWFQFHPVMLPAVLADFGACSAWVEGQIKKAESNAVEIALRAAKDSIEKALAPYSLRSARLRDKEAIASLHNQAIREFAHTAMETLAFESVSSMAFGLFLQQSEIDLIAAQVGITEGR